MRKLGIYLTSVCLIAACGQDRTLDDYLNKKALQEATKYSKIAGTYTGLAYQKDSKKPLAEVMVTLISSSVVDNSSKTPSPVPVLLSKVTLKSPHFNSELVVNLDGGYYIEDENMFQSFTYITEANQEKRAKDYLSLKGIFRGSSLIADLQIASDQDTALKLDLHKSKEWLNLSPNSFAVDKFPGPKSGSAIDYEGVVHMIGGKTGRATMKITPRSSISLQQLGNLLSQERTVYSRVMLVGPQVPLAFKEMKWNVLNHTLIGTAKYMEYEIRLECASDDESTSRWSCDYQSSGGGSYSRIEFTRIDSE